MSTRSTLAGLGGLATVAGVLEWLDKAAGILSLPSALASFPESVSIGLIVVGATLLILGFRASAPERDLHTGVVDSSSRPITRTRHWLNDILWCAPSLLAAILYGSYYGLRATELIDPPLPLRLFGKAYSLYQIRLGSPASGGLAHPSRLRYHEHERAFVLWADQPAKRFYVLQRQPQHFRVQDDPVMEDNQQYENDEWLRRNIMECPGEKPPIGGVAKMFRRDSGNWRWIGCLHWERMYRRNIEPLAIQEFQHGRIIGPVNAGEARSDEWILFILFDSDKVNEKGFQGDWLTIGVENVRSE